MKKYTLFGLVLSAGCIITAEMTAQTPAPPPPTKFGIVNLQSAMQNTKEGKAAGDDLTKRFIEPRTKDLTDKQTEITDLTEKLKRGGNTMSQTAKDDLQHQIDVKTKSFQRDVEDFNADRDEEERKILDDLVVKMRTVIEKYAVDNGYRVILDATNPNTGVLWWSNEADLTQQIVDAYDKTQPLPSSTGKSAAPPKGPATGVGKQAAPPASPTKPPAGQAK